MSLNLFRTKMKKKVKGHHDKNNSDPNSAVSSGSSSSSGFLGIVSKDPKRKSTSVSSPPDVSSPVHQVSPSY